MGLCEALSLSSSPFFYSAYVCIYDNSLKYCNNRLNVMDAAISLSHTRRHVTLTYPKGFSRDINTMYFWNLRATVVNIVFPLYLRIRLVYSRKLASCCLFMNVSLLDPENRTFSPIFFCFFTSPTKLDLALYLFIFSRFFRFFYYPPEVGH